MEEIIDLSCFSSDEEDEEEAEGGHWHEENDTGGIIDLTHSDQNISGDCPICYDTINGQNDASILRPCGHVICKLCCSMVNQICPICKNFFLSTLSVIVDDYVDNTNSHLDSKKKNMTGYNNLRITGQCVNCDNSSEESKADVFWYVAQQCGHLMCYDCATDLADCCNKCLTPTQGYFQAVHI